MTIAILGGTGPQGQGLAMRFALAGVGVVLGSRATRRAPARSPKNSMSNSRKRAASGRRITE